VSKRPRIAAGMSLIQVEKVRKTFYSFSVFFLYLDLERDGEEC
jgi:hypothetical protein